MTDNTTSMNELAMLLAAARTDTRQIDNLAPALVPLTIDDAYRVNEEVARRRNELGELEKRLLTKEESLDRKIGTAEKREQDAENRSKNLDKREKRAEEIEAEAQKEADSLVAAQRTKLEQIAGLTTEQAKKDLIRDLENEARLLSLIHISEPTRPY